MIKELTVFVFVQKRVCNTYFELNQTPGNIYVDFFSFRRSFTIKTCIYLNEFKYAYYERYFIPQSSIAFPPQSTYPEDKTINV